VGRDKKPRMNSVSFGYMFPLETDFGAISDLSPFIYKPMIW